MNIITLIVVIVLGVIGIVVGVRTNAHRVKDSFWFLLAFWAWLVLSGVPVLLGRPL